ncbi:hypothetical protein EYF80_002274 [Liparis tanakae]|uniref:Uncharacterized protein n=1 Tax=Liparis tanakae TaxID=230148 RepID=A0A4Z2JC25_9TELE|nr:hypothetical protein EYF80_002274 [Liparis tanakae]
MGLVQTKRVAVKSWEWGVSHRVPLAGLGPLSACHRQETEVVETGTGRTQTAATLGTHEGAVLFCPPAFTSRSPSLNTPETQSRGREIPRHVDEERTEVWRGLIFLAADRAGPRPNPCSVALNVRMKTKHSQGAPCPICKRPGTVAVMRHQLLPLGATTAVRAYRLPPRREHRDLHTSAAI